MVEYCGGKKCLTGCAKEGGIKEIVAEGAKVEYLYG